MDTYYKIHHCGIIILAAGASKRLGQPKQLLPYKGKSLLQNIVSAALDTTIQPVMVITGAHATAIMTELAGKNVQIIYNNDWPEGIASSIRCGIRALEQNEPGADGAIFLVCDQPHITTALLLDLLRVQKDTGRAIVAASYSGISGTPVLFHKSKFQELLLLKGDKGAGKMLQHQIDSLATLPFPEASVDIDTMGDYERLQHRGE